MPGCQINGPQHKKNVEQSKEEEKDGPRIFSDFYYMNTAEDSVPMLALKFSRSGRPAATALPAKGVTGYGQKFFTRFVKSTGGAEVH